LCLQINPSCFVLITWVISHKCASDSKYSKKFKQKKEPQNSYCQVYQWSWCLQFSLQSEIIWNLWTSNLCNNWHRFPSLDLLSLPFTKVNHWVFPSLPDVQQQKLVWLLGSTPSTLAFKVVMWNGSHVVMLGCWLWPGKILWIVNSSGNAHALMLLYGKLCLNGTIIRKVAWRAWGWAKLIATSQAAVHLKVELPYKT
jgi:hypothetical protein